MSPESTDVCPLLVNVTADRLWVYPVGVYCCGGAERPRVPAATTVAHVCSTGMHRSCPGYRERVAQGANLLR